MNIHKARRILEGLTLREYCRQHQVGLVEQSRREREGEPPRRLVDRLPAFVPAGTSEAQLDALIEVLREEFDVYDEADTASLTEAQQQALTVDAVARFAAQKHDETGCKYDGHAYRRHLEQVAAVGEIYMGLVPESDWTDVRCALWCHDLIEDCRVSWNDLCEMTNPRVADMVYRVSNESGKNRVERGLRTYPKIREDALAVFVKLCDRIANTRYSVRTGSKMQAKYRAEYPAFRYALHVPGQWEPLWQELDALNISQS